MSSRRSERQRLSDSTRSRSSSTVRQSEPKTDSQATGSHFDTDIQSRRQLSELQRLEQTHGEKVHDWLDEGMPREAMGNPREMRAFRMRKRTSTCQNGEMKHKRSVQRSAAGTTDTTSAGETGVPDPVPQLEREADETARQVMAGSTQPIQRLGNTGVHLQRMDAGPSELTGTQQPAASNSGMDDAEFDAEHRPEWDAWSSQIRIEHPVRTNPGRTQEVHEFLTILSDDIQQSVIQVRDDIESVNKKIEQLTECSSDARVRESILQQNDTERRREHGLQNQLNLVGVRITDVGESIRRLRQRLQQAHTSSRLLFEEFKQSAENRQRTDSHVRIRQFRNNTRLTTTLYTELSQTENQYDQLHDEQGDLHAQLFELRRNISPNGTEQRIQRAHNEIHQEIQQTQQIKQQFEELKQNLARQLRDIRVT